MEFIILNRNKSVTNSALFIMGYQVLHHYRLVSYKHFYTPTPQPNPK